MTPKEKAWKMFADYRNILNGISTADPIASEAKKCALIAVDELISQILCLMKLFNEDRSEFEAIELDYLNQVKEEINKL